MNGHAEKNRRCRKHHPAPQDGKLGKGIEHLLLWVAEDVPVISWVLLILLMWAQIKLRNAWVINLDIRVMASTLTWPKTIAVRAPCTEPL